MPRRLRHPAGGPNRPPRTPRRPLASREPPGRRRPRSRYVPTYLPPKEKRKTGGRPRRRGQRPPGPAAPPRAGPVRPLAVGRQQVSPLAPHMWQLGRTVAPGPGEPSTASQWLDLGGSRGRGVVDVWPCRVLPGDGRARRRGSGEGGRGGGRGKRRRRR